MSIQSAAPSTLSTHNTSTRSVFGRRVKEGAEFEQFKKEVLATYKDSDINIKEEDIKREYSFTRTKIPIPIIGRIILFYQSFKDKRLVRKAINKSDTTQEGDKIVVHERTKRLLPYFSWEKGFFNHINKDFKELADKKPFNVHKANSLGLNLIEPMFGDLDKFTIDLKSLLSEYRFSQTKKNHRYLATQFTLKEKPEELQS